MNCIVKKTVLKFGKHLVSRRVVNLVDNRQTFRKSRQDFFFFVIYLWRYNCNNQNKAKSGF